MFVFNANIDNLLFTKRSIDATYPRFVASDPIYFSSNLTMTVTTSKKVNWINFRCSHVAIIHKVMKNMEKKSCFISLFMIAKIYDCFGIESCCGFIRLVCRFMRQFSTALKYWTHVLKSSTMFRTCMNLRIYPLMNTEVDDVKRDLVKKMRG